MSGSRLEAFEDMLAAVKNEYADILSKMEKMKTDGKAIRGSQHGDLKPEATGASGLCQMPPAAFSVHGNKVYCVWKFVES